MPSVTISAIPFLSENIQYTGIDRLIFYYATTLTLWSLAANLLRKQLPL